MNLQDTTAVVLRQKSTRLSVAGAPRLLHYQASAFGANVELELRCYTLYHLLSLFSAKAVQFLYCGCGLVLSWEGIGPRSQSLCILLSLLIFAIFAYWLPSNASYCRTTIK